MICDNKIIIQSDNIDLLHKVQRNFKEDLRAYDNFSEFVYTELLEDNFDAIKNHEYTFELLKDVESIDELIESDLINLFGTRWIDVLKIKIDYKLNELSIYFDSKYKPPLILPLILAEKYNINVIMESVESYQDSAYLVDAFSMQNYTTKYMSYYEFQYKVNDDVKCLKELFAFCLDWEEFEKILTREHIHLTEKDESYLREKFNETMQTV